MAAAKSTFSQEYEKWVRVITLIDFAGRRLCRDVLFNQEKLPTDGALLYEELKGLKSAICRFQDQADILCPTNGITDHTKFDVTLLTSIIDQKFGDRYKSLVSDLRNARNRECHRGDKKLSVTEFEQLWNDTTDMLKKYGFDLSLVNDLKWCDIFSQYQLQDIAISIQGNIDNIGFDSNIVYCKNYPLMLRFL